MAIRLHKAPAVRNKRFGKALPAGRNRGQIAMRMDRTGVSARVRAAAAGVAATVLVATTGQAGAQQSELSKESIEKLLEYAWAITPDRFTKPNGETVEIDRKDPKTVEVPIETAREIIRVGRLSAHAQLCDLKEEHAANFRSAMAREALKKVWTEQQMVFMNQLHMVTVMLLTGQLKVVTTDVKDGKEVQVTEDVGKGKASCSPEQRTRVRDAIVAYLKTGPQAMPADPAAGGPAPAPAAAPTPTSAPAKK